MGIKYYKKKLICSYQRWSLILICFLFLLIVSVVIHEIGHGLICAYFGNKPYWINYSKIGCIGEISKNLDIVSKFFGGLFSSFIFVLITLVLLCFKRFIPYKNYLLVIFISIVIIQLINALMESSIPKEDYEIISGNVIILLILVFIVFTVTFFILDKNMKEPKMSSK